MLFSRRVKRIFFFAGAVSALMMLSACGKTQYGAVQFISTPNGAEVVNLRDESNLGSTPLKVVWESDDGKPEYVTVQFRKQGHEEKITSLWVNKRYDNREDALDNAQPIKVDLEKR